MVFGTERSKERTENVRTLTSVRPNKTLSVPTIMTTTTTTTTMTTMTYFRDSGSILKDRRSYGPFRNKVKIFTSSTVTIGFWCFTVAHCKNAAIPPPPPPSPPIDDSSNILKIHIAPGIVSISWYTSRVDESNQIIRRREGCNGIDQRGQYYNDIDNDNDNDNDNDDSESFRSLEIVSEFLIPSG
ncbi:hypothetical protein M0802_000034 [Mischocyttarus mexicanus]|nr:hypothetical protein M0802_000034 [Mischocyttarus mexicanus]